MVKGGVRSSVYGSSSSPHLSELLVLLLLPCRLPLFLCQWVVRVLVLFIVNIIVGERIGEIGRWGEEGLIGIEYTG